MSNLSRKIALRIREVQKVPSKTRNQISPIVTLDLSTILNFYRPSFHKILYCLTIPPVYLSAKITWIYIVKQLLQL